MLHNNRETLVFIRLILDRRDNNVARNDGRYIFNRNFSLFDAKNVKKSPDDMKHDSYFLFFVYAIFIFFKFVQVIST